MSSVSLSGEARTKKKARPILVCIDQIQNDKGLSTELGNKTQYLHNDTWKALEIKNKSFVMIADRPVLKVVHILLREKE